MKLLFDQNLPSRLSESVQSEFPGTKHVRNLGLARVDDEELWAFARRNEFVLVTKDADF